MWQGILGLAEARDVHSGGKDVKLGSYEERPCALKSGAVKSSHGAGREMGSGSQGHTQRAWVAGRQVIGQGEKIGTESGSQGGLIVRVSHLAYDGLEKEILGKEKDSGPRLCKKLEEAEDHLVFRLNKNCYNLRIFGFCEVGEHVRPRQGLAGLVMPLLCMRGGHGVCSRP